jgi:hypothetical protein
MTSNKRKSKVCLVKNCYEVKVHIGLNEDERPPSPSDRANGDVLRTAEFSSHKFDKFQDSISMWSGLLYMLRLFQKYQLPIF